MKYKVGDKVKIKTWEEMEKEFGLTISGGNIKCPFTFMTDMEEDLNENFPNRELTIDYICEEYYKMKGIGSNWSDNMIKYSLKELEKREKWVSINSRFEILDL